MKHNFDPWQKKAEELEKLLHESNEDGEEGTWLVAFMVLIFFGCVLFIVSWLLMRIFI